MIHLMQFAGLLVTRHIRFRRIPPDTQQRIGRDVAGERH
jgi:hypothetical protein